MDARESSPEYHLIVSDLPAQSASGETGYLTLSLAYINEKEDDLRIDFNIVEEGQESNGGDEIKLDASSDQQWLVYHGELERPYPAVYCWHHGGLFCITRDLRAISVEASSFRWHKVNSRHGNFTTSNHDKCFTYGEKQAIRSRLEEFDLTLFPPMLESWRSEVDLHDLWRQREAKGEEVELSVDHKRIIFETILFHSLDLLKATADSKEDYCMALSFVLRGERQEGERGDPGWCEYAGVLLYACRPTQICLSLNRYKDDWREITLGLVHDFIIELLKKELLLHGGSVPDIIYRYSMEDRKSCLCDFVTPDRYIFDWGELLGDTRAVVIARIQQDGLGALAQAREQLDGLLYDYCDILLAAVRAYYSPYGWAGSVIENKVAEQSFWLTNLEIEVTGAMQQVPLSEDFFRNMSADARALLLDHRLRGDVTMPKIYSDYILHADDAGSGFFSEVSPLLSAEAANTLWSGIEDDARIKLVKQDGGEVIISALWNPAVHLNIENINFELMGFSWCHDEILQHLSINQLFENAILLADVIQKIDLIDDGSRAEFSTFEFLINQLISTDLLPHNRSRFDSWNDWNNYYDTHAEQYEKMMCRLDVGLAARLFDAAMEKIDWSNVRGSMGSVDLDDLDELGCSFDSSDSFDSDNSDNQWQHRLIPPLHKTLGEQETLSKITHPQGLHVLLRVVLPQIFGSHYACGTDEPSWFHLEDLRDREVHWICEGAIGIIEVLNFWANSEKHEVVPSILNAVFDETGDRFVPELKYLWLHHDDEGSVFSSSEEGTLGSLRSEGVARFLSFLSFKDLDELLGYAIRSENKSQIDYFFYWIENYPLQACDFLSHQSGQGKHYQCIEVYHACFNSCSNNEMRQHFVDSFDFNVLANVILEVMDFAHWSSLEENTLLRGQLPVVQLFNGFLDHIDKLDLLSLRCILIGEFAHIRELTGDEEQKIQVAIEQKKEQSNRSPTEIRKTRFIWKERSHYSFTEIHKKLFFWHVNRPDLAVALLEQYDDGELRQLVLSSVTRRRDNQQNQFLLILAWPWLSIGRCNNLIEVMADKISDWCFPKPGDSFGLYRAGNFFSDFLKSYLLCSRECEHHNIFGLSIVSSENREVGPLDCFLAAINFEEFRKVIESEEYEIPSDELLRESYGFAMASLYKNLGNNAEALRCIELFLEGHIGHVAAGVYREQILEQQNQDGTREDILPMSFEFFVQRLKERLSRDTSQRDSMLTEINSGGVSMIEEVDAYAQVHQGSVSADIIYQHNHPHPGSVNRIAHAVRQRFFSPGPSQRHEEFEELEEGTEAKFEIEEGLEHKRG